MDKENVMEALLEELVPEDLITLATEGLLSMGMSQEEIDTAVADMSPTEAKRILADLPEGELGSILESAAVSAGLLQEDFDDYAGRPAYLNGQKPISRDKLKNKGKKLGAAGLALTAILALGGLAGYNHLEVANYRPVQNVRDVMYSQYQSSGARDSGVSFRNFIRQTYKVERDFEGKIGYVWNWDACKEAGLLVPEHDPEAISGEGDFWYLDENPFNLDI